MTLVVAWAGFDNSLTLAALPLSCPVLSNETDMNLSPVTSLSLLSLRPLSRLITY